MPEDNRCQGCPERQRCEEVYRRMGQNEGPSVTFNVVMAFLLPLLIFIAVLTAGQVLLKKLNTNLPVTAISFFAACLATAACILIASLIVRKKSGKVDK